MSTALQTIGDKLSSRFGMNGNTSEVISILQNTAFKGGNVSDAQLTSLMIVADQYGLNPWTKEIYAFPDKGGIVPVVGIDGWSRIINEHKQFDGIEFDQNDDSCTCIIYRKDRSHPTKVTEHMAECRRDNSPAWKSHPKRMLRHKAMIQCARIAFGFVGIYDQDEAERITEIDITPGSKPKQIKQIECYSDEKFVENSAKWEEIVRSGKQSAERLIDFINSKQPLTEEQKEEIKSWEATNENA